MGQSLLPDWGAAVCVTEMHPHLQWNRVLLLVMSCYNITATTIHQNKRTNLHNLHNLILLVPMMWQGAAVQVTGVTTQEAEGS